MKPDIKTPKNNSYLCLFDIITHGYGVWRSWLAHRVWDAGVEGSSPFTPTTQKLGLLSQNFSARHILS